MTHDHDPRSKQCREMFARLSEYLDEELPPNLCEQIEDHLGDCPPCEKFLESLRRTVELTRSLPPDRLPDEVRRAASDAWRKLQAGRD